MGSKGFHACGWDAFYTTHWWHTRAGTKQLLFSGVPTGRWGEGRQKQLKLELTFFKQVTQDRAISGKFWEGLSHGADVPQSGKRHRQRDLQIFERLQL